MKITSRLAMSATALIVLVGAAVGVAGPASAVESGNPYERGPAPTATSAQGDGPFATSKTTLRPADTPGFGGGDLYLPTDRSKGTFGGVVMIPGYSGTRQGISWIAPRLASQGFVVLLMDPPWIFDGAPRRAEALKAAVNWLKAAPQVEGTLDRNRLAIWGFSMGGGGSLRAGEARPDLKAVVNIFPWDVQPSYPKTTVPSLVLAGQKDTTAVNDKHSIPAYDSMTNVKDREWVELTGAVHTLPLAPDGRLSEMTTAWLKRYVDDDTRYAGLLCSAPQDTARYSRMRSTICGG